MKNHYTFHPFLLTALFILSIVSPIRAEKAKYNTPGAGNPIIPGYFADPTVKKFGDTYYIYATTDGNGGGLGPSQVWVSKDFVNWTILPMNWPSTHHIWAPDVMHYRDGKYYMYYCEPCQIYCGVSETPRGPWKNIYGEEGKVLIYDRFVTNAITLDGQSFVDDDGSVYIYFGTWGIYKGFGCGVAKFSEDLKSFTDKRLIVNTEAHDFFEAPFVIKKDGIYYFTYSSGSCHDETYRVQYATSKVGPMGPYQTAENNPILATTPDKSIHGPGHHSILQEGDDYYIIYHRHDIPNSTRGMHRQLAADKLIFGEDGSILPIKAGHQGIGYLQENTNPFPNLAYGKKVTASSSYNEDFRAEYAIDDNNATLWRPRTNGEEWIEIDLGEVQAIRRIWTQFEYATSYYQYKTETSLDGQNWTVFADKTNNRLSGSPMVDYGQAEARYVRLTVTGQEKNGLYGAIWNIKIFSDSKLDPPQLLIGISGKSHSAENTAGSFENNYGMLSGHLHIENGANVEHKAIFGKQAICLPAGQQLRSDFLMPKHFRENRPFTLSYKIFSTASEANRRVAFWSDNHMPNASAKTTRDMPSWHDVAWVSNGKIIKIYVDGLLAYTQKESPKSKQDFPLEIRSGKSDLIISDIRLYNWEQTLPEIEYDSQQEMKSEEPASQMPRQGLIVDISAKDYPVGSELTVIQNMAGNKDNQNDLFEGENALPVVLKQGCNAFAFDGKQSFRSHFGLPQSMTGNAPYTIEATLLNPALENNECIIDLIAAGGELETVTFGNGNSRENGIVSHNGSFENMGLPDMQASEIWQHWAITFDGYMEKIFLNGQIVKAKDIVLRLPASRYLTLGANNRDEQAFSGYLQSLKVYDMALSDEAIRETAGIREASEVLLLLSARQYADDWQNEGVWGGTATSGHHLTSMESNGKLALSGSMELKELKPTPAAQALIIQFACDKKIGKNLNIWHGNGLQLSLHKKGLILNNLLIATGPWPVHAIQQLVIQQVGKEWKVYLNGQYAGKAPMLSVTTEGAQTSGLSLLGQGQIGDESARNGLAVFELKILQTVLSETTIQENYHQSCQNDLQGKSFALKAQVLSPGLVRLLATENDQPIVNDSYSYSFQESGTSLTWTHQPEMLMTVAAVEKPVFQLKVQDKYGNISPTCSLTPDLSPEQFIHYQNPLLPAGQTTSTSDEAEANQWDGLTAGPEVRKNVELDIKDNHTTLTSAGGNFEYDPQHNGPFLYKEVEGDFLMEVKISDLTGLDQHNTPGYNEGGLMIMDDSPEQGQNLLHLGIFPLYNCGNMLTDLSRYGRFQYQNFTGWHFSPWLQVERSGHYVYFRTSENGKDWIEMPHSPILKEDWAGKSLKIGLYQVTYSDNKASFTFEDFQLWLPQK